MAAKIKRIAYQNVWRVLALLGLSKLDYHRHYARPDLDLKYKTLMGCASDEEFDQTGRRIVTRLSALGLQPDSKVLDVGCGTGRLATQLLCRLNEKGEYYGCDISQEAIEFCRRHYVRPNFHFVRSEMTRIPLTLDAHFDFIWCYSVFTHVYPNEMTALMKECRRLLSAQGLFLASYYIAGREPAFLKNARTFFGNRDRMEYGENYLKDILRRNEANILGTVSIQKQPIFVMNFARPPRSSPDANED
jgi:SAM-dependent methyltransferase